MRKPTLSWRYMHPTWMDVLVILLGIIGRHLTSQRPTAYSCIIMDCGSVNSRRHIDVISIANALEAKQKGLAAAMPGLYASTGSDFTTAFYMKGKITPREVLENDTEGTLFQFFSRIVSEDQPDQSKVEEFTCSLYDIKGYVKDVNKGRHVKMCQMTVKMDKVLVYLGYMGFFGPALPDYLFHEGKREEDSIEDHQSDVATVFENDEDSNSENAWNDDSESETEI